MVTMLSFRKAVIIAAFVITCIFLLPTLHHTPKGGFKPQKLEDATGTKDAGISHEDGLITNQRQIQQIPIPPDGASLLERLRYQYPYDPEGKFPAYIWQTWKATPASGEFGESLRPMEASWTEKHPNFVHEVITDKTASHLIRYLYGSVPEVLEAYSDLPMPVLKADFFRYLILLARGGIYSDIDTEALKSAVEWLPADIPPSEAGLIVGIEADPDRPDWKDWYSRRIQFCQWTIQAKVGHPVLRSIVAQITEETLRMKREGYLSVGKLDRSIVEFTGPARWTDTIFDYINDPSFFDITPGAQNISWKEFTGMEKPKKVGDVVVLPITSFSPGVQQMGAKEKDDELAFVFHDFKGSWKEDWEQVKPTMDVPAKKTGAKDTKTRKDQKDRKETKKDIRKEKKERTAAPRQAKADQKREKRIARNIQA